MVTRSRVSFQPLTGFVRKIAAGLFPAQMGIPDTSGNGCNPPRSGTSGGRSRWRNSKASKSLLLKAAVRMRQTLIV